MKTQTLERKRPATEPGAGESHLGGGNHGLNYTRTHRLLHAIERAYPLAIAALAFIDLALLAIWAGVQL